MNMKCFLPIAGLCLLLVVGCSDRPERVACNSTTPTWNVEVIDIVANSCWGSSCHGTGSSEGDFTTYNGIKDVLLNGKFETEVLETRRMPQDGTLPDSTLATLQCWLENGFPET
jgi:hypothetical protein